MEVIKSLDNAKVKLWNSLKMKKYRDKNQLFIIQEKHLIQEALKHSCVHTLIVREDVENIFPISATYVSAEIIKKLSDNASLNDYIAICKFPNVQIGNLNRVFILENVQDPGNVGTIIRMAYCFGYDAVYLSSECADVYNYKTISASQGAIFHVPVKRIPMKEIFDICALNKLKTYATSLKATTYLQDIKIEEKYALIMGNEGNGLTAETENAADYQVKIEMENFDSLNVAMAASIIGYNFRYHQ